jgi:hypothetical protein
VLPPKKYVKIWAWVFCQDKDSVKKGRRGKPQGQKWALPCDQEVGPCGGPSFGPLEVLCSSLSVMILLVMKIVLIKILALFDFVKVHESPKYTKTVLFCRVK